MNVPSGYTALDLVGFTDKASYSSATTYVKNDLVHYSGNIWRCKVDDTINVTPGENANWTLFIGEPTNLMEAIIAPVELSPTTATHSIGDQLIYNDVLYKVVAAIAIGDTLTVNTNIVAARKIVYQISGIESDIATIEPTSTASQAYTVGEYLFYDWEFYRVTSAISQGDTIVTSGASANVEEVTVGGELKRLATDKQPKTMSSPVTVDGTSEATVEGAIGAINTYADSLNQSLANEQAKVTTLESNGNWRTGLRFKNLGTSFTSAQATALANGDFSDFWNGDYWVIGGHNWRIVDNSGWARRRGDTNYDSNSLVIMPDDNLVTAEAYLIDNANDSGHGYSNCAYRTRTDGKGKAQCKTIISNAFGSSHIASHRELMSTSRGTGGALGWGWQDADVELPSEVNIYGHPVWGCGLDNSAYGASFNVGDRWGQFMLFRLAPYMAINCNQNYWLRDIHSASGFAGVTDSGGATTGAPSGTLIGLRPLFILK